MSSVAVSRARGLLFSAVLATSWMMTRPCRAQDQNEAPAAPAPSSNVQSVPAATPAPAASVPAVPAATPAPADAVPALPAAAPAPADTVPSIPAATPGAQPASLPVPVQEPSGYHDPLQQPIVVPAGPPAPQALPVAHPAPATSVLAYAPYDFEPEQPFHDHLGSTYIPDDSTIYPMALRLYSLGYLDTAFISLRPWTRRSLLRMLQIAEPNIMADGNDEAVALLARLNAYLEMETPPEHQPRGTLYGIDTVYTRLMGIAGPTLRDSYHLGQTFVNDYGRPYERGFNNITGFSTIEESGRFSLYLRGEFQHAPSGQGYSFGVANELAAVDEISAAPGNPTIPYGNIPAANNFRLQEADLSFHLLGHEISGGKTDSWLGPGYGGAFGWSNNAENIYALRINRVEPLRIPWLSRVLGPFRYDFQVGALQGHTFPRHPWVHSEMAAFRPTSNVEFGFQRSVVWGGHAPGVDEPVTLHSFLRSFFDFGDTEGDPQVKGTPSDPGARFTAFNFSWRLPFLTHSVTLYTDSEAHDDVTPPSAPRRAAYRPGLYISHLPHAPKMDFRVEGVNTDISTLRSIHGSFNYWEGIQKQAYTNNGFIFGDWIGREGKGGQAWLTWHLSPDEFVQVEYLHKKTAKDFIPGGTTQNQAKIEVVKRLRHELELDAWVQFERWKAPVPQAVLTPTTWQITGGPLYYANAQSDTAFVAQFTWHPKLRRAVGLNGK